ncbi:hypothetical protein [Halomonas llamarensis]|uniref:Uncharacterized protein n=1 Tax=Halomonas llamarensis TaxID=2945104 RepID=A0ABT0STB3_9GAMM|nr:hypothetical protein [Halomonas llamarensis]MCL7931065.1 hypothetical protein [Halomonas llamarensis]
MGMDRFGEYQCSLDSSARYTQQACEASLRRLCYLEENTAAASIILTADEQQQLEAATEHLPVTGERYTPKGMKGVNT